ncbi:D-tyrosyl-tRNA(Tyr) deacylase [Listeria welshimeri]|uniref:D-aminoacyl-tRNA deacylase n=1 Tax=Listeria welshimeri TaxID=1643 RepID=UPI0010B28E5E|nr:D-aminoacyl-tRNA deacylase [Listeria welshimeri]MBC1601759.1 D-tyrosyl-tRNA(Tyr) deacylase [Listeria welshimeri]MBC1612406.1 D-tyrosyl-tRNA(Tyr) deacylase [Listeria welshimeri]MBC1627727.1 D-tyrosyl-tRNA(Tyr) deacylase [Listeria welshimeri]MBC1661022.1 D-tyrosyl-tRNA(Tyr) deacylase [Listeria welshimeri]MBC1780889.1 D-tyrosyl-tRNA(Tyr) deacylase [Listeria welshimeri]
MRVLLQRCYEASVSVEEEVISEIAGGLCLLVGFTHDDTPETVEYMAKKVVGLRIFEDESKKMNISLAERGGAILSVSQFTLYADVSKGKRPSFTKSAPGEKAERLYDLFNTKLSEAGFIVETGVFGAFMDVKIINHGPITMMLDSAEMRK